MFSDLIGKTYQEVGRCYGLCRIVCGRLGIQIPEIDTMQPGQEAAEIEKRLHLFWPVVGRPEAGDLVHIRNPQGPPHVAVVVGPNRALQVTGGHRVHGISLTHIWIRSRIAGIYRYAD